MGLGGGRAERYPADVPDGAVSAYFLYNSRRAMLEHQAFERVRRLGQHHWVMARHLDPDPSPR